MKYRNTTNSYVPLGPRESVPPFGVTRDFTQEEFDKSNDLRYFVNEKKYLVPWDGTTPLPQASAAAVEAQKVKKAQYQTAADSLAGEVKTIKSSTGKVVEYISATDVGSDGVANFDHADDMVASMEGRRSLEHIEEGVTPEMVAKPGVKWQNASDAFEAELKNETDDVDEFNDDDTLADKEELRDVIPDADDEITNEYTRILKDGGRMGATDVSVRTAVEEAASAGAAALAEATAPNFDEGERIQGETSPKTAALLAKPFNTKKWVLSKEMDQTLLKEVAAVTQSENVRSLAQQRLQELEAKA